MTQAELTKLIYEFLPYPSEGQHYALRQFAKLVAQHEREACAKVCEDLSKDMTPVAEQAAKSCATLIRARSA